MSRKQFASLAVVAVASLAVASAPVFAQSWAGKGRAFGSVKDDKGNPIEGARIQMYKDAEGNGPGPKYTDKKGKFGFGGLGGGLWTVLIDADGYKPSQGAYAVNEFQAGKPVQIVLVPDPFGVISVGDGLLEEKKYAEARAAYENALAQLPEEQAARLRSRIGDTYLEEGNAEAARAEYLKSLPLIPEAEQAHIRLQLAKTYEFENNNEAVRGELEKVLEILDPAAQGQVLLMMARSFDSDGQTDKAIETLQRALELDPENVQLLQITADFLTRTGREDEAREYLARLPEDVTLPADMVLNIGIRLYNEGDVDKAFGYFNRAVDENPSLAEAYYYRGLVNLNRNQTEEAKADFGKLLELDPESAHAAEVNEFLKYLN